MPSSASIRAPWRAAACVAALASLPAAGQDAGIPLEEIVVTASLRGEALATLPASVTLLDAATVKAPGVQHLADLLGLVPNLNWSGGTSRPRYLQLRGIGELEQYQGAPNPSVAFLVDAFDFSGIGMVASTLDVEQIEVLRGPQGTRFGANALAGLVKLKTHEADGRTELRVRLDAGDDDSLGASLVAGDALGEDGTAWRLAAQRQRQGGHRNNVFLGRDDTNARDETTVRGKLRVPLGAEWQADLAMLHAELDNGFDVFAPDNSLQTHSDRPGRDAQRASAGSLELNGALAGGELRSSSAWVDSASVYSFDGDWGNDELWGENAPYDYYSRYGRQRTQLSQDLRWIAGETDAALAWLLGAYAARLEEDTAQRDDFAGEPFRELDSRYTAEHFAPYTQVDWRPRSALALSAGLRLERRDADYADSDGARLAVADTMLGGHLSARLDLGEQRVAFAALSRGYKAGGFNIGALVPVERRRFAPEYLWNLETGLRFGDGAAPLRGEVVAFYMRRESQQVASSLQLDPGDPLSYLYLTDNAARGRNLGLEASLAWRVRDALELGGTLGLLDSEYLGYRYGERDLDGRAQAHAPQWQYSLHADWRGSRGFGLRADVQGSDAFYFDTSHDQRSEPYVLLNLGAGWSGEQWSVSAWVRNVFDAEYAVRGFYFGLEPPDYPTRLYTQQGDPRRVGLSVEWRWQ